MRRLPALVGVWGVTLLLTLAVWAGPALAQGAAQEGPVFVDVSQEAGIDFHRNGDEKAVGQAWGDIDNDGWLDLYLTDTEGPNILYRNNGDGTFSRSDFSNRVSLSHMDSRGASFADFDNDGWADLYVLNYGENTLFHNQQGQGFVDITDTAGIGDSGDGRTASWADYDGDGWLDLYVANWSCEPLCGHPSIGDRDRLYHNNGDGSFTDVIGLLDDGGGSTTGAGFVATWVDYDNDGDLDIYLVNDEFINPVGNMLWRNDGPGCNGWCFTQVAKEAGANTYVMGMGLATADFNNDGHFDFYFSNVGPMTLLQNQGDGTFENVAESAGVEVDPGAVGWGTVAFDFNNDGWQDIYLALEDMTSRGSPANPLYENLGDGTFRRVLDNGADDPDRTVGVASADWNNDGFVEMVVGNYDEGYKLYQNLGTYGLANSWLSLRLLGSPDPALAPVNRDGVGTRVTLMDSTGRTQMQEVKNGSSLAAGDSLWLHFGLGDATITEMHIRWPDGTEQTFDRVPANRRLTLAYPLNDDGRDAQQAAIYGPQPNFLPWIIGGILAGMALFFIIKRQIIKHALIHPFTPSPPHPFTPSPPHPFTPSPPHPLPHHPRPINQPGL